MNPERSPQLDLSPDVFDADGEGAKHIHLGGLGAQDLDTTRDDAAAALQGQELDYTEDEAKALLRKQDWILVPTLLFGAGVALVDKITLGSAATLNMISNLKLKGNEYPWTVSIYFFGLLLGAYPSNYLLQRYHSGKVAGIACCIWGSVMLATMGVQNFSQLAAVRFLLGIFEAALPSAYTLITARFYTQQEQPWRYALWGIGNTFFPVPFILLFYGLAQIKSSLEPWRWIFMVMGLFSILTGVAVYIFLPDSPSTCWWLSPRQKAIAVERIARTQSGIKSHVFKTYQVREALCDVKTWLLGLLWAFQQAGVVIPGNFGGIILKRYGFSGINALLLGIPNWLMGLIGLIIIGWISAHVTRFQRTKTIFMSMNAIIVAVSGIMLYTSTKKDVKNEAIGIAFVAIIGLNSAGYPIVLTLIAQNFAGSTKKQTVMVVTYTFYCVSNLAIPQSFRTSQAPGYRDGLITVVVCQGCLIAVCAAFFLITRRENKQRLAWLESQPTLPPEDEARLVLLAGLNDETDKQNKRFLYYA